MKGRMSSEQTADLCYSSRTSENLHGRVILRFTQDDTSVKVHHGFLGVAVGFAPGVVVGVAFD